MNVLVDRTGLYQYVNCLVFVYILYPVWKQYHIEQLLKRQYKYVLAKQKWLIIGQMSHFGGKMFCFYTINHLFWNTWTNDMTQFNLALMWTT